MREIRFASEMTAVHDRGSREGINFISHRAERNISLKTYSYFLPIHVTKAEFIFSFYNLTIPQYFGKNITDFV